MLNKKLGYKKTVRAREGGCTDALPHSAHLTHTNKNSTQTTIIVSSIQGKGERGWSGDAVKVKDTSSLLKEMFLMHFGVCFYSVFMDSV